MVFLILAQLLPSAWHAEKQTDASKISPQYREETLQSHSSQRHVQHQPLQLELKLQESWSYQSSSELSQEQNQLLCFLRHSGLTVILPGLISQRFDLLPNEVRRLQERTNNHHFKHNEKLLLSRKCKLSTFP